MSFSEADLKALVAKVKKTRLDANTGLIEKAYKFAAEKLGDRQNSFRMPYFKGSLETAKLLADLRIDEISIAVGLLHHVLTDTEVGKQGLLENFGPEITNLVEVIRTGGNFDSVESEKMESVLLSLAKDFRIMIIALADRVTFMKELKNAPVEMQKREAKATLDIYAPLAHKLGVILLRNELEDRAFRILEPDKYAEIGNRLQKSKRSRMREINKIKAVLERKMKDRGFRVRIEGRIKHLYGIYMKMVKKGISFDAVHDANALRIIVKCNKPKHENGLEEKSHPAVEECYKILGEVHSIWRPLPGEFDDYIARPKQNKYMGLQTTVDTGSKDNFEIAEKPRKPIEIQIMTDVMDDVTKYGEAAHWRYKGEKSHGKYDRKLEIIHELTSAPRKPLKVEFYDSEIAVFTPKQEVVWLPEGATALDFAYAVHSDLGNKCDRVLVNGKLVPLDHVLKSNDKVEVLTSATQKPKSHWFTFVRTEKARKRIRQTLQLLEAKKFVHKTQQIEVTTLTTSANNVKLAKCCCPVVGDEIIGLRTTKRKVSVHRNDCSELQKLENKKLVQIIWGRGDAAGFLTVLKLTANDRSGILADVLKTVSSFNASIISANARAAGRHIGTADGNLVCELEIKIKNRNELNNVMDAVKGVSGVVDVNRA